MKKSYLAPVFIKSAYLTCDVITSSSTDSDDLMQANASWFEIE